jgi:DNA-binding CsgD family transcriptional regulator
VGTAGKGLAITSSPKRGRRIVRRSRLLATLGEAQARTVLLVAPAGYGKTMLARQWLEEAGGAWIAVTPASADLALLARDLATAVGELVSFDSRRVEAALSAGRTPDEQVRAVGRMILGQVKGPVDGWIVVDDYHLLMANPAAEELIASLEQSGRFRLLIASRERPAWATPRRRIYLETVEFGAAELALDDDEVAELLPPDRKTAALRRQARGWPAVIGLAAYANSADVPLTADALSDTLYDFLAEEMYERAPLTVQRSLTSLAALPPVTPAELSLFLGEPEAVSGVLSTGLAYADAGRIVIHPLARAFLVTKLRDRPDANDVAHAGFEFAHDRAMYDEAFRLVEELALDDCLEQLIVSSYAGLIRTGRVATLDQFRQRASGSGHVREVVLDLIAADQAVLSGDLRRAEALGKAAADRFESTHPLKARGYLIAGRAALLAHRETEALSLYSAAKPYARSSADIHDCAFGKVLAAVYLEDNRVDQEMAELEGLPVVEPADRVRLEVARIYRSFADQSARIQSDDLDVSQIPSLVSDPSLRTGWAYALASALTLQSRYREAEKVLRATLAELDEFGLSFAVPHVEWSLAAAELGLRHFARCEGRLRKLEQHPAYSRDLHMQLNVRALRARLYLSQRRANEAIEITADSFPNTASRAMYGEYLATRALALAVSSDHSAISETVERALSTTAWLDTRVLCEAALAVRALDRGPGSNDAFKTVLDSASGLRMWDGLVCAIRASPGLLSRLTAFPEHKTELRDVLLRSNDVGLAKSVGLVTRSNGQRGVLSSREREIIDQVRQGRKSAEIATSLFISPGTVKSHMDHIFEKLGVRTRAEAVARYAEIERAETVDSEGS